MSDIIRFEPFGELMSMRKEMDRLFDGFFNRPLTSANGWNTPLVDMYQTDDDVIVKVTLPGVESDDLDIQVSGDTLSIRGEVGRQEEVKEATYHLREQRYSSFARSLLLPVPVVADKANAEIKNGVLTLTLPKADEVKPKAISVKAR